MKPSLTALFSADNTIAASKTNGAKLALNTANKTPGKFQGAEDAQAPRFKEILNAALKPEVKQVKVNKNAKADKNQEQKEEVSNSVKPETTPPDKQAEKVEDHNQKKDLSKKDTNSKEPNSTLETSAESTLLAQTALAFAEPEKEASLNIAALEVSNSITVVDVGNSQKPEIKPQDTQAEVSNAQAPLFESTSSISPPDITAASIAMAQGVSLGGSIPVEVSSELSDTSVVNQFQSSLSGSSKNRDALITAITSNNTKISKQVTSFAQDISAVSAVVNNTNKILNVSDSEKSNISKTVSLETSSTPSGFEKILPKEVLNVAAGSSAKTMPISTPQVLNNQNLAIAMQAEDSTTQENQPSLSSFPNLPDAIKKTLVDAASNSQNNAADVKIQINAQIVTEKSANVLASDNLQQALIYQEKALQPKTNLDVTIAAEANDIALSPVLPKMVIATEQVAIATVNAEVIGNVPETGRSDLKPVESTQASSQNVSPASIQQNSQAGQQPSNHQSENGTEQDGLNTGRLNGQNKASVVKGDLQEALKEQPALTTNNDANNLISSNHASASTAPAPIDISNNSNPSTLSVKDMLAFQSGRGDAAEQVLDGVSYGLKVNKPEIVVKLNPEYLGDVKIRLTSNAMREVTARLIVDNPETRELLSSQMSQLKQNLESQGIRVEHLTIGMALKAEQNFGQDAKNQDSRNQNNSSFQQNQDNTQQQNASQNQQQQQAQQLYQQFSQNQSRNFATNPFNQVANAQNTNESGHGLNADVSMAETQANPDGLISVFA